MGTLQSKQVSQQADSKRLPQCHWDERASRRPWVLRSKYFKNQNVSYTQLIMSLYLMLSIAASHQFCLSHRTVIFPIPRHQCDIMVPYNEEFTRFSARSKLRRDLRSTLSSLARCSGQQLEDSIGVSH